jgi:chorismate mutase
MDSKGRLNEIRGEVAALDRQIAEALEARARLAKETRSLVEPSGAVPEDRDAIRTVA